LSDQKLSEQLTAAEIAQIQKFKRETLMLTEDASSGVTTAQDFEQQLETAQIKFDPIITRA